ncbi:MAG: hypothetical protein ABEN55_06665 [Bradymonadaceae bacterium]
MDLEQIREYAEQYEDEPSCKCPDPLHCQGDAARLVLKMCDEIEQLRGDGEAAGDDLTVIIDVNGDEREWSPPCREMTAEQIIDECAEPDSLGGSNFGASFDHDLYRPGSSVPISDMEMLDLSEEERLLIR